MRGCPVTTSSRACRPFVKTDLSYSQLGHSDVDLEHGGTHLMLLACLASRLCQCIMPGMGGMMLGSRHNDSDV